MSTKTFKCEKCEHVNRVEKPKRKPNAYNLFVSEAMKHPSIQAIPGPNDKMKACAQLWRRKKEQQQAAAKATKA